MPKFFIKFLFVVMASVMIVTACGTSAESPTAYVNPPTAYVNPPTLAPSAENSAADASQPTEPSSAATDEVSFSADIQPMLEKSCGNCHGGNRTEKGLDVTSYAALMNGSQKGPVIVVGDAANSSLVTLVANGKMPKRGPKLTPEQVDLIIAWINAGAPNN